jgi:dolichol-phosphate mannosyltransferase
MAPTLPALAPSGPFRTPAGPNLFVVPAYDEEENLPRLFADLEARPALFPPGSRLVIVDDGSRDGTAALVEAYAGPLPVELVRLDRNSGPGAAFRAGFAAALAGSPEGAYVVTLEADTTSDLDALPAMLARAHEGADLVLAAWSMVNVSRRRRLLSAAAGFTVRHALRVQFATVSSFFRVYRATLLMEALDRHGDRLIREPGFACKAELLAKLAALGARIDEVEVSLDTSRRVGDSKMPVLKTVLCYWRMIARQRTERARALLSPGEAGDYSVARGAP